MKSDITSVTPKFLFRNWNTFFTSQLVDALLEHKNLQVRDICTLEHWKKDGDFIANPTLENYQFTHYQLSVSDRIFQILPIFIDTSCDLFLALGNICL